MKFGSIRDRLEEIKAILSSIESYFRSHPTNGQLSKKQDIAHELAEAETCLERALDMLDQALSEGGEASPEDHADVEEARRRLAEGKFISWGTVKEDLGL